MNIAPPSPTSPAPGTAAAGTHASAPAEALAGRGQITVMPTVIRNAELSPPVRSDHDFTAGEVEPAMRSIPDAQLVHQAAMTGDVDLLRSSLDLGADVNEKGPRNTTLLMVAASAGQAHSVRLLLDRGADPHARCAHGLTAFEYASDYQHEAVKAMLKPGARPTAVVHPTVRMRISPHQ